MAREFFRDYDPANAQRAQRRLEDRPSCRALAEEFGLPVTQVTNHLAWARRELRRLVLERAPVSHSYQTC